jgi:arylformamidase
MGADWIDISVPLSPGLTSWPGEAPFGVQAATQGGARVSTLSLGTHSGTHVDAPLHYIAGGQDLDAMRIEALMGPATLVHVPGPGPVTQASLAKMGVNGGRILLRTRNSDDAWFRRPWRQDYVGLDEGAARFLVEQGCTLVGSDYLSVAHFPVGRSVHEILMRNGTWILEGLDLSGVAAGPCELVCLPLRIAGGDGAPARAFVRVAHERNR